MAVILFVNAHQDDETLSMGAAIMNHSQAGHDCYSCCITDGSASGIKGTNGIPSDVTSFVNARNTEMKSSLGYLGATLVESSYGRMKDGTLNLKETTTFPGDDGNDLRSVNMEVVKRVRDVLSKVSASTGVAVKNIRVKTHCHHDAHPDHRAVCQAVLYLLNVTKEITDVRHYVSPGQWNATTVYKGKTYKSVANLGASIEQPAGLKNFPPALLSYVRTDTKCGGYFGLAKYGIGYYSVKSFFDLLMTKQCSYYHVPPVCTMP